MPYITVYRSPGFHQLTFEEIISGEYDVKTIAFGARAPGTRTYYTDKPIPKRLLKQFDFCSFMASVTAFYTNHAELFAAERRSLYSTFHIPKASGGLRQIDAPKTALMGALRELKALLESFDLPMYHTAAYGFVRGRSTIDAVKRHQKNDSHWFMKVDFHNFFGTTTFDFVKRMLREVFPFSEIMKNPQWSDTLLKVMELCFLDGVLPQGTPISPMLTNLVMIPVDYKLSNSLRDFEKNAYVYTRYADDMLVSSKYDFKPELLQKHIREVLKSVDAPYSFKKEKTRYGSRAGSNWNLGVMLNKDNDITIGSKNKRRLRAMLTNYTLDHQKGVLWELHDVQVLRGLINYYMMVEKDAVTAIIDVIDSKFGGSVMDMIHADLRDL